MKTHLWDHVEFQGCLILGGCDCAKFFPDQYRIVLAQLDRPLRFLSAQFFRPSLGNFVHLHITVIWVWVNTY